MFTGPHSRVPSWPGFRLIPQNVAESAIVYVGADGIEPLLTSIMSLYRTARMVGEVENLGEMVTFQS